MEFAFSNIVIKVVHTTFVQARRRPKQRASAGISDNSVRFSEAGAGIPCRSTRSSEKVEMIAGLRRDFIFCPGCVGSSDSVDQPRKRHPEVAPEARVAGTASRHPPARRTGVEARLRPVPPQVVVVRRGPVARFGLGEIVRPRVADRGKNVFCDATVGYLCSEI